MKPAFLTSSILPSALLVLVASSAFGQGNIVSFSNLDLFRGVNAPFYDSDGTTRLAGENYVALLYVGPLGTPTESLMPIGRPQPFRTGNFAGYWVPTNILVLGVPPGAAILAQVRFWDTQGGTLATFEQARGAGAKVGFSIVLQLALSPSGTTPLTGLKSASLIPVVPPLAISEISAQTIDQNTSTGPLPFTVAGPSVSSLLVTGSSSNPSLIRTGDLVFAGNGSNRSVTVTPLLDQTGTATITLVASDSSGGSASTAFTVSVIPVNSVMRLHITRTSTNTIVTWTATNGVLQQCERIGGDWKDVTPEPTSPYRTSSDAETYFRLRKMTNP